MSQTPTKFKAGLSRNWHNKDIIAGGNRAHVEFPPRTIDARGLFAHATTGKKWSPGVFKNGYTTGDHFLSAQLIGIDCEKGRVSYSEAIRHPFVTEYALFAYPTPSDGKNGEPHYRIVFQLPTEETEPSRYQQLIIGLIEYFNAEGFGADPNCKDVARRFNGSDKPGAVFLGNILPFEIAGGLLADRATDDMLKAFAPPVPKVKLTGDRAESYSQRRIEQIISQALSTPAGTGQRHAAFIKLTWNLIGMDKSGEWPGLENVEALIRSIGEQMERPQLEITESIRGAREKAPIMRLELPDRQPPHLPYGQKPAQQAGQGSADQSAPGTPPIQPHVEPTPVPRFFADGNPDSWRETLLNIDATAALAYEVLTESLRTGSSDPDNVTIAATLAYALAAGYAVSYDTMNRGFKVLERVFFADLHTEKEEVSSVSKFAKNVGNKGVWRLIPLSEARPRLLYAVAPRLVENAYPTEDTPEYPAMIAQLSPRALADGHIADVDAARDLAQFDQRLPPDDRAKWTRKRIEKQYRQLADRLDNLHSTPLSLAGEEWKPRDTSMYRVCYLRARKVADPNALRSNREIANALGLKSPKTAAAIVRRAGLQVYGEQTETRQITSAANVEQQVNKIARFEVKGKPRYIEVQTANEVTEIPYSAAELTRQIERGASVSVKFQVANRHEVIADAKPIERPRRVQQQRIELLADDPGAPVETVASDPPRVRLTTPRANNEPTLGYTSEWVRGQLALRLKRMKWTYDNRDEFGKLIKTVYRNPETDEFAPMDAPAHVLLGLLLGRNFAPADSSADLIAFAVEEWGAIPRSLLG